MAKFFRVEVRIRHPLTQLVDVNNKDAAFREGVWLADELMNLLEDQGWGGLLQVDVWDVREMENGN